MTQTQEQQQTISDNFGNYSAPGAKVPEEQPQNGKASESAARVFNDLINKHLQALSRLHALSAELPHQPSSEFEDAFSFLFERLKPGTRDMILSLGLREWFRVQIQQLSDEVEDLTDLRDAGDLDVLTEFHPEGERALIRLLKNYRR